MNSTLAARRLENQRITSGALRQPADVVRWFGAIQAQEYEAAKWGLALRMNDRMVTSAIDQAVDEGRILRTHVMRPTWHFVTPDDIRWLLDLTAGRVHQATSSYRRRLELDGRTLARGTRVIERALRGGRYLDQGGPCREAPTRRAGDEESTARATGDVRRARRRHLQRPST